MPPSAAQSLGGNLHWEDEENRQEEIGGGEEEELKAGWRQVAGGPGEQVGEG